MKTILLAVSALLGLAALVPASQAEASATLANPCESGIGVYAALGDLCVDTGDAGCTVWIEWHAIPSTPTCLVAPIHSAGAANPECMDVYSRTDVGTIAIVRKDSCSLEIYECPYEGAPISECRYLLQTESSAASPVEGPSVDCYYVYTRTDVGTLTIIRRTSCSVPEFYTCPYQGAPLQYCQPLLSLATASSQQEPMCMYYYFEYHVGPVTYVQRDSCHSETYVCGEPVKEFVATAPEQDPVALADCTVDSLGVLA